MEDEETYLKKSLQEDSSSLSVSPQTVSFSHAHETDLIPDPRFADVQRAAQVQTHTHSHSTSSTQAHLRLFADRPLGRLPCRSVERLIDDSTASLYGEKKQGSCSQSLAPRSMTHTPLQYAERVGQGQVVASSLTWCQVPPQSTKAPTVSKKQNVFLLMVLVFRRR